MKKVVELVLMLLLAVGTVQIGVEAWDDTISNEQLVELMEKYPENKKLAEIAKKRGFSDGHCDFDALQKMGIDEQEELKKLMEHD